MNNQKKISIIYLCANNFTNKLDIERKIFLIYNFMSMLFIIMMTKF